MLKKLTWLLVLVIFGSITWDYAKNNVALDETVNEVVTFIEEVVNEPAPVIAPISNSAVVPVDSQTQAELKEVVTTVEELSESIYYYASRYETQFSINYKGDTAQTEPMIQQAYDLIEQRDPYLFGHLSDRNIQFSYTSHWAELNFNQQYLTTYEQERLVNGKVQAILESVDTTTMTDYDKVKFVNDYIVQNTVYSQATTASAHSAYAVLFESKGVCQGYALLAYKMLKELGIENLYVTGQVAEGGHAWNLVQLEGAWYHLDTTWNDPLPDRGNGVRYDYFLVSDGQLQQDHAWDMTKFPKAAANY